MVYKSCENWVRKAYSQSSKWTLRPVSDQVCRRIHNDHYGLFLSNYWALMIVGLCFHYPKMYFTTSADTEFTNTALWQTFSLEEWIQLMATVNIGQFAAEKIIHWNTMFSPADCIQTSTIHWISRNI